MWGLMLKDNFNSAILFFLSDSDELVGVNHRKRCWSWGKNFREYRALLAQLRT